MSKSNSKKEIFSLRQEFHQALEKQGFIAELPPYIYTTIAENPYPSMDVPP